MRTYCAFYCLLQYDYDHSVTCFVLVPCANVRYNRASPKPEAATRLGARSPLSLTPIRFSAVVGSSACDGLCSAACESTEVVYH